MCSKIIAVKREYRKAFGIAIFCEAELSTVFQRYRAVDCCCWLPHSEASEAVLAVEER